MTLTAELITLWTQHINMDAGRAQVVDSVALVEQAHERPDSATGIVVLGLAEQQGAAPLEVAQIHVVAECGPDYRAGTVDRQHHFRLGIVPGRIGPNTDLRANADGRQGLRL